MQFLHGTALSEAIREVLIGSRRDVAVAFWGRAAKTRLGIDEASGMRIACDLQSGACNPSAIQELFDDGAVVFDVPGLHAKVYIGDERFVVCSANVSANGMGEENEEVDLGLEAGGLSHSNIEVEKAAHWFDSLIDGRNPISQHQIDLCAVAWRARRAGRPLRNLSQDFVTAFISDDLTLLDRGYRVAVYEPADREAETEKAFIASGFAKPSYSGTGLIPYFWDCRDWKLQANELILSFVVEDGKAECEGVWRVLANLNDGQLVPTAKVAQPSGMKFQEPARRKLANAVTRAIAANDVNVDSKPLDIGAFRNIIIAHL